MSDNYASKVLLKQLAGTKRGSHDISTANHLGNAEPKAKDYTAAPLKRYKIAHGKDPVALSRLALQVRDGNIRRAEDDDEVDMENALPGKPAKSSKVKKKGFPQSTKTGTPAAARATSNQKSRKKSESFVVDDDDDDDDDDDVAMADAPARPIPATGKLNGKTPNAA